jgi:hypothetical protein
MLARKLLLLGCCRGFLFEIPPRDRPVLGLGLLLLRLSVSLFMTGSNPERINFTDPAQPRRIKTNIYKNAQSPRRGKTIFMQGVIPKVR